MAEDVVNVAKVDYVVAPRAATGGSGNGLIDHD
jgi:hypothetical protein